MCIIVYKDEGVDLPTDTVLRTCFRNNPDGAGYMYRNQDGTISVRKGYMTSESLIQSLHSINNVKDKEMVIHFRYGTHGEKSPGNTHPFPITNMIHQLRRLRLNSIDSALVHNGIIAGMSHKNATLSDTMCLVKIMANESEQSAYVQQILTYGKFIIMDRIETRIYGEFYEDPDTGLLYSNEGYKPVMYYTSGGKWYSMADLTENDIIDEYNELYGTQFTTMEEIDAHVQALDKCDECIWFEDLTGMCYNTNKIADSRCKECNFIAWNSKEVTQEDYDKCQRTLTQLPEHELDEDREVITLPDLELDSKKYIQDGVLNA